MPGTITRLAFQQHRRDRVSVYLDGQYAFGLPAMEAARLRRGQFLSDEEIAGLRQIDVRQRAYERLLRLLASRPRSTAELTDYLKRQNTPPEVVADVLDRLTRDGYLDDAAFVRFWVENRERCNPRGPHALRQELRRKGVSGRVVDEALAGLDWEESAYRAAQSRQRRWAGLEYADFRRAVGSYLGRRGFDYDVINDVVQRLWAETGSDDNTERGTEP